MTNQKQPSRLALAFAAQSLQVRGEKWMFAGLAMLSLVLIAVADLVAPDHASVGALGLLPVLAAGWVLPRRMTIEVVAVAIVLRGLVSLVGAVHPVTAVAQIITLPILAVVARLATVNAIRASEGEVRIGRLRSQGRPCGRAGKGEVRLLAPGLARAARAGLRCARLLVPARGRIARTVARHGPGGAAHPQRACAS